MLPSHSGSVGRRLADRWQTNASITLGPREDEFLARCWYLARRGPGLGVVTGEDGCGKTTIAALAEGDLQLEGWDVLRLDLAAGGPSALLDRLCQELGLSTRRQSAENAFEEYCMGRAASRRQWVLLIDHLDQADRGVDQTLQLVARLQAWHVPATVFCFGPIAPKTETDAWSQLVQRADCWWHLDPWSLAEVTEHLTLRIAANPSGPRRFSELAIERLTELSGGNPRRIAQLAHGLWLAAEAQDAPVECIDEPQVEEIVRWLMPQILVGRKPALAA
jgi:type II secretory pathway predicted ATPase ExeA